MNKKEKLIRYVAVGIFGLCGIPIIVLFFSAISKDTTNTTESFENSVPKMSIDESFSIDDLTSFNTDDFTEINDFQNETIADEIRADDLLNRAFDAKNNVVNESLLDSILDEQEEQDRKDEILRLALKSDKEEKHKQYIQHLRKKRAAKKEVKRKKRLNEIVEVEASIYMNQRVMPNDRAELILAKDAEIFGKEFIRGTPILAYIQVRDSRLFLDIENIQGEIWNIKAYDSYDFREGIYSKRAAELWDEYKNDQAKKGNNELSSTISETTSSTLVGNVIQDLGAFFRNKKVREKNKILLINDHSVILKITRKKGL